MAELIGACWPTAEQALLIRAACGDAPRRAEALAAWQARVSLAALDRPSNRLLSLLHGRLPEGTDPVLVGMAAEASARCEVRNRALLAHAGHASEVLRAAGIPGMLLKGVALVARGFMPVGGRPMADCDLLVPVSQVLAARDALLAAGWRLEGRIDPAILSVAHATSLRHTSGLQLDLHWHVLNECLDADADVSFWDGSVEVPLGEGTTRTLCAADMLLHTCVHGLRWSLVTPIRWVSDALAIIHGAGPELDWERVVREAKARVLTLIAADTLRYLRDTFDVPMPPSVIEQMAVAPLPSWARAEHAIRVRPRTRRRQVQYHWLLHRRLAASGSLARDIVALPSYVRRRWQVSEVIGRFANPRH